MIKYCCGIGLFILGLVACNRPVAKFMLPPETTREAPATLVFENQSEEAESYQWSFGDGNTSIEENPTHEYLQSGNYEVLLTAFKGRSKREFRQTIQIAPPEKCLVYLTTEQGKILIELFDDTPQHRDNFLKLVDENYYDGLIFHRVIKGFMIQGGDPNSREADENTRLGSGGPGYQVPAELSGGHYHIKGALAAARTGDAINPEKKSSGSQFYIVQGKPVTSQMLEVIQAQKGITYSADQKEKYISLGGTPFLDKEYTVFGQVIQGLDIVDKIADVQTKKGDRPVDDVKMQIRSIK